MPPSPSEAPPPPYRLAQGEGIRSHAGERAAVRESREAHRSSFLTWIVHGLSNIDNDFTGRDAEFRAEFGHCLNSLLDDMQR